MTRAVWKFLHGAPDFPEAQADLFQTETSGHFSGPASEKTFTYADTEGHKIVFKGDFVVDNGAVTSGTVTGFSFYEGETKIIKAHGYAFSYADLVDAFNQSLAHASGPFQDLLEKKTTFNGSGDGDLINGTHGSDRILGHGGNDFLLDSPDLTGSIARDHLDGGKGDDFLWAGEGKNVLTGGSGSDTFVFVNLLGAPNANKITDFSVAKDMIELDTLNGFGALTPGDTILASEFHIGRHAADADDHIIYNQHTGALYYDHDGIGGDAGIKFAQLSAGLHLTHSNFAAGDFD